MPPTAVPNESLPTNATLLSPRFGWLLVAGLIATAPIAAGAQDHARTGGIDDTLVLHYMGHAIGHETYSLRPNDGGWSIASDFDYRDRGRRTHVVGTMRLAPDFAPALLEIARVSDTNRVVETLVDVRGGTATVVAHSETTHVALSARAFAIAGTTPVVQHLALVRWWLAHGRPARVDAVPGGPTNVVTVERRGRDTLNVTGHRVVLERYAIDGVVWGSESVWVDEQGRLAAYTTAGGGGLTLAAVRQPLDSAYARFVALATRDRLAELARLSRTVRPEARGAIALVGGTLVDGTGREPMPNSTVVVVGGRIVAAGPSGSIRVPNGTQRVDVRGQTIVPGLWDMHAHVMQVEWAPMYLATGVTTVRDMGNEIDFELPLRDAIRSGRAIGPTLLLAGLVDGPGPDAFGTVTASTPDEGRAIVRRYHDLGFQQLKLYTLLSPAVVAAITSEAHRLGMTVTGHVPASLTILAAVDSGMDHIAHMPIRGEPGSDSVRRIVDALRVHGTVLDPTASWGELLGHSSAQPVASFQPGVDDLPPVLAQRIRAMGVRTIDTATAHARLARTLGIIRELHEASVPVVAGTDEGVPGFSVSREMELYQAAGFTPMDALRAATAVSARAMHLDGEVGTLEPGRRADLLVLDRSPLDNVANVRALRFVMKDGVLYRAAELRRAAGLASAPARPISATP
jgi:imidazolonepropionase-like amidohydrolase